MRYFFSQYLMPKKIFFSLLIFFTFCNSLKAQHNYDSTLRSNIAYSHLPNISDSDMAVTYRNISLLFQGKNIDSAILYGQKSITLAKKLKSNRLLTPSLIQQGSNYIWAADFDKALDLVTECISIASQDNNFEDLQGANDLLSYIYQLTGVWDKAWIYAIKSLEINLQHSYESNYSAASAHSSLANIYAGLNDYANAEKFFYIAKQGYVSDSDFDNLANCYLDIAKMYIPQKKYLRAKTNLDTAYRMFVSENEDIQIADALETYGLYFLSLNQYDSSYNFYIKAFDIYVKNNLPVDEHRVKISLAKIAYFQNNFSLAKQLLLDGYDFYKSRKETSLRLEILLWLNKTDMAQGIKENASSYFNEYLNLSDSIKQYNAELRARELTTRYELEKAKQENEHLKAKNELQTQRLTILVISGIIVFITSLLLSVLYRQKNLALNQVKHLQQQTESNNKELANLNNVKDKLISMIAHDLRSPLASLQNTLSLAIDNTLNKEEFARLGRILEGEMYNLRGMLDNMLLWARQQVMDIKVNKTKFNLSATVKEILSLYENNIIHKGLIVQNNLPEDLEVYSDKDILTTVTRNILSNAIKFTNTGKNISISHHITGSKLFIAFKDEGTGITDDVLQKINRHEFVSHRGTSNEKGTGLGILFSRELLNKLGENLSIETFPDLGTTVMFSITQIEEVQE